MTTKSVYKVQILVDGKPIKEYTKDGKVFVESKAGTEYLIRVKNNSGKRALAIISVDGINVITGKVATPEDTGYVVNSSDSIEIQGYRKDLEGGGRFKFTEKDSGYSKEVDGTGVNSGVIGVMIVQEKSKPVVFPTPIKPSFPWEYPEYPKPKIEPYHPNFGDNIIWCQTNSAGGGEFFRSATTLRSTGLNNSNSVEPTCSVNYCQTLSQVTDAPVFDSATTWGSKFDEHLTYTDFERSTITETHNIYYASRESLKSMGVINDAPPAVSFPESFPGFAKPPANWKA